MTAVNALLKKSLSTGHVWMKISNHSENDLVLKILMFYVDNSDTTQAGKTLKAVLPKLFLHLFRFFELHFQRN